MKHLLLITLLFILALLLVACCAGDWYNCDYIATPVDTISPVGAPRGVKSASAPDIGPALERFEKWARKYLQ